MVVNILRMSMICVLGPMELETCFVFLLSYSQDEQVAGVISSAVCNHPSLKELTTGRRCSQSLVNGAVGGIVRKAGVKKLDIEDVFPSEL